MVIKTKDWGICDRCQKPATCGKYSIEVGSERKDVEVCEPCFFSLNELTGKWFSQPAEEKAFREAENRKGHLDGEV